MVQERSQKNIESPIMNEIITKILTDKNARNPEQLEAIVIAQNSFESWE
jgi:hypothetical protein